MSLRKALSAFILLLVALSVFSTGGKPARAADETWLLASDIHLNPYDRAKLPVQYHEDSNVALLDSSIAEMRRVEPDPRVIVLTGDFLAHHFPERAEAMHQRPADAAIATMQLIATRFNRAFPRAQFVVAIGNNDDPCGDYAVTYGSAYLHRLAKVWAPLVNRAGSNPRFAVQFGRNASSIERHGSLQIVAINSIYWSLRYFDTCAKQSLHPADPGAKNPGSSELTWLQNVLAKTPKNTTNLLVMHIPIGVDAGSTMAVRGVAALPFYNWGANAQVQRMVVDPDNHVSMVLAGHTHRTEMRTIGNVPLLIVPSISPIYGNSPTFFVLHVTTPSPQHLRFGISDYAAYMYRYGEDPDWMDKPYPPSWEQAYDFNTAFEARGVTAESLHGIHDRIVDGWRPPPIAEFELDRYVICAQDELASGYAKCSGVRRHEWMIVAFGAFVVILIVLLYGIIRRKWAGK